TSSSLEDEKRSVEGAGAGENEEERDRVQDEGDQSRNPAPQDEPPNPSGHRENRRDPGDRVDRCGPGGRSAARLAPRLGEDERDREEPGERRQSKRRGGEPSRQLVHARSLRLAGGTDVDGQLAESHRSRPQPLALALSRPVLRATDDRANGRGGDHQYR